MAEPFPAPRGDGARRRRRTAVSESFPPRSLREVLAKKSAPPAPLCPQPGPSLPLSPHTMGAVPHLHGAKGERERRSPSPPREATAREGDEERQSQRDPPRSLREVLAKKSAPPAPVYAQPDPSLPLSPHTTGAAPHLHDAKEEKERLSPSPPREATVQPGEEEVRAQRVFRHSAVLQELSEMTESGLALTSAHSLSTRGCIPSRPTDLCTSIPPRRSRTTRSSPRVQLWSVQPCGIALSHRFRTSLTPPS
eukprot:XP_025008525.1 serine/arginine repetitive matrix protein 1-like isoform X4 [Gallus gallus]